MNKNINNKIKELRALMKIRELDGFIIPHEDEFLTEYIPPSSDRLSWISGFTGSAGLSIINQDSAAIFIDGRYTTQVKMESPSNIFDFEDIGTESQKQWIKKNCLKRFKLGFNPKVISLNKFITLKKIADENNVKLIETTSLIDELWLNRPKEPKGKVVKHEERFSGKSFHKKRADLIKELDKENIDSLLISESDNSCWLLNIRGSDLDFTPLMRCFSIFDRNGKVYLFSDHNLSDEIKGYFDKNEIIVLPSDSILNFLKNKKYKNTLFDPNTTPLHIAQVIQSHSSSFLLKPNPCNLMKACKNTTELKGSISAHIRDGVALTKFLFWLENQVEENSIDEITIENKLLEFRKENNELKSLSFSTIAGAAANGAIVHYKATEKTNKILRSGDILLLDSGGQYLDGTTDVTRTVPVFYKDNINEEIKDRYTRVLKGHIAIASSKFPKGTKGLDLDPLAREYLLEIGLNYSHGTGHGVGSFLGVHEGPQNISPMGHQELKEGMIISNEPGYYKENEYGIRIENLIYVKQNDSDKNNLKFETLTKSPINKYLMDINLLDNKEKKWLNNYHKIVFKEIAPFLNNDQRSWLEVSCSPIH